jgi:Tfp pilus assembly protein PilF
MRRAFLVSLTTLALLLIAAGCRSAADTNTSETQSQFGVRMARMNLWREAMFRFRRAIEIDPQDAQAHNNLAVALEANGDFDGAAKAYREALRLDRANQHIQKNYSRFVEFMQKSKKREAGATTTTTAAVTTTATTTTPTTPGATTTAAPPAITDTATTTTTTTNPPDGGSR